MDVSGGWRRGAVRVTAAGALLLGTTVAAIPLAAPAQAAEKKVICWFDQRNSAKERDCLVDNAFTKKSSTLKYHICWAKKPSPKTRLEKADAVGAWQTAGAKVQIRNNVQCSGSFPWETSTEVTVPGVVGPITRYRFVLPASGGIEGTDWEFSACVLPLKQAKKSGKKFPCGWAPPAPEPTPTPTPDPSTTPPPAS